MNCRVIKVGGSLFASSDVGTRVADWLVTQPPRTNVIVAGGGVWADAVRRLDRQSSLSVSSAHGLAIRSMSLTAFLLSHLMQDAEWVDQHAELQQRLMSETAVNIVYDVGQFMRNCEPLAEGLRLPHGWHVTSDSIAARLAQVIGAHELILLKAVQPENSCVHTAAAQEIVDEFFPRIASSLLAHGIQVRFAMPGSR